MPTNKNAIIRYIYLDQMLSSKYHYYTTSDLCDECNRRLKENGFATVSKRCIEMDLKDLQEEPPFYAELEYFYIDGKKHVRYRDLGYSIFNKAISDDEKAVLREALSTLGRFQGLPNFEWLEALQQRIGISKQERKVISFSENQYLKMPRPTALGELFNAIVNRQVLQVKYRDFSQCDFTFTIHPYLLKQYNNRWYLIGAKEDGSIYNLALDRILEFTPLPMESFIECPDNLEERFEDIVGVTLPRDGKCEEILLWVADSFYGYLTTKPMHGSQTEIKDPVQIAMLREKFPNLKDGHFIKYDCIINIELVNTILAMGPQAIMLTPQKFNLFGKETSMKEIVTRMAENYR